MLFSMELSLNGEPLALSMVMSVKGKSRILLGHTSGVLRSELWGGF